MKRSALLSFVFLVMPTCGTVLAQTVKINSLENTVPAGGIVAGVTVNPGGKTITMLQLTLVGNDGSYNSKLVPVDMTGRVDLSTTIKIDQVAGQVNYQGIVVVTLTKGKDKIYEASPAVGVFATGPKDDTDYGSATIVPKEPIGKEKVRIRIDYKAAKGWKASDTAAFLSVIAKGKDGGQALGFNVKHVGNGVWQQDVSPISRSTYSLFAVVTIEDVNDATKTKLISTRITELKD